MIFPELLPDSTIFDPTISGANSSDSFESYRRLCDQYSGLMRIGVEDEQHYKLLQVKRSGSVALSGMMSEATNDELGGVVDDSVLAGNRFISIVPRPVYESLEHSDDIAKYEQRFLSDDLTQHLLKAPDETTGKRITEELNAIVKPGERLVRGDGAPEFVFLSKFDTSGPESEYFKNNPPQEIVTRKGHIVTSSREKITDKLPELIELHKSVFDGQTLQVGYYGGLDSENLEEIVNNPEFTPVMGYDPVTDEALAFTLYSSDFKDFDTLPWLNPRGISKILDDDKSNHKLAIPLVITSKLDGLGLFDPSVAIAGHAALYDQRPDTMYVAYESNGLSVLYTPKIIQRNLTNKLGYVHLGSAAEATFMTEPDK